MAKADDAPAGGDDGSWDLFTAAPLPQAPLDDAQRLACLRLIRTEGVGPVTFRALVNRFGGAREALDALPDLARKSGRRQPLRVIPAAVAEAELEAAAAAGAAPLFTIEPGYPALLAAIDVPPPLVYVRGRSDLLNRPTVAIVGARQASAAGTTLAATLARDIGAAGWVVVSGLARGIDTAAHRASLASGTVAVVAGGIDHVYPPENAGLRAEIAERGCLVSELPPGYIPRATDFPRRNRLIAGMVQGVVVVEAAERSGSLITARLAAEIGRDVLAVPGHPLDPRAAGTNRLLRDGATLVTSADDICAALGPVNPLPFAVGRPAQTFASPTTESARRQPEPPLGDVTALVLAALGPAPIAIDQLCRASGIPIRDVQSALLELNLAGQIELHGSQLVSRRS